MVQFVKPNLLGTRREFLNQFVNPITNGQFVDSTEGDVKIMKRRAHVLHKMLEGLVQVSLMFIKIFIHIFFNKYVLMYYLFKR